MVFVADGTEDEQHYRVLVSRREAQLLQRVLQQALTPREIRAGSRDLPAIIRAFFHGK